MLPHSPFPILPVQHSAFSFPLPRVPVVPSPPIPPFGRAAVAVVRCDGRVQIRRRVRRAVVFRSLPPPPPFPSGKVLPPAGSVSPCLRGESMPTAIPHFPLVRVTLG